MKWFGWFRKRAPEKTWIGTVHGRFVNNDNVTTSDVWWHLAVDEEGTRSWTVEQSGSENYRTDHIYHRRYQKSIRPWLESGSLSFIQGVLDSYNPAYWEQFDDFEVADWVETLPGLPAGEEPLEENPKTETEGNIIKVEFKK